MEQKYTVAHNFCHVHSLPHVLSQPEMVSSLIVVDISPVGTSRSIHLIATFLEAMKRVELPPGVPLLTAKKYADTQLSKVVHVSPQLQLLQL